MKRLLTLAAIVAACLTLLPAASASADGCTLLGGTVVGSECQISGNVGNKDGVFNLDQSLRMLAGSKIVVPSAPNGNSLVINVCAAPTICSVTMEQGAEISGNVTKEDAAQGTAADIEINATGGILLAGNGSQGAIISSNQKGGSCSGGRAGDIKLTAVNSIVTQAGSQITANGKPCPAGSITLLATQGLVTTAGLISSESTFSGTGANQRPGGGPITIIARCDLTVGGTVRSKGQDAGADLIHLEGGCKVVIDGLVESTAGGHAVPTNPPNHCYGPVGNPSRPDKPQNSTACIEVWAGDSLTINASAELNADLGLNNSSNEGVSWIDLFARGNIVINGDDALPFSVHANGVGGSGGNGEEGGIVTVKSKQGSVAASGKALQATSTKASNSDAGQVTVEAAIAVAFINLTPTIEARGNDQGGAIAVRAFTGALDWLSGVGDVRPNATGTIALVACGAITTTGTNFNGEVPTTTTGLCTPTSPTLPAYVILPTCLCGGPFPPGEVECPEDRLRIVSRTVDETAKSALPNHTTLSDAVAQASFGEVIGVFINTNENVSIGSKALTITQCTRARITALDPTIPTIAISSPDRVLVIGLDTVGGTSGWLLDGGPHEIRSVRASGASEFGIEIVSSGHSVSWNVVSENGVGIRVQGSNNDLRGGNVEKNFGDGVQFATTAANNVLQGATIQQNGGNGVLIEGTFNTIRDNSRIDSNVKNGVLITGSANTVKSNTAGSDKTKGNGKNGFKVTGPGNTLDSNKANASGGDGFVILGGTAGSPNVLRGNQSNSGASGGNKENKGAEYRLGNSVTSLDGNKADGASVAKAAKCPFFPKKNKTTDFATQYICE